MLSKTTILAAVLATASASNPGASPSKIDSPPHVLDPRATPHLARPHISHRLAPLSFRRAYQPGNVEETLSWSRGFVEVVVQPLRAENNRFDRSTRVSMQ